MLNLDCIQINILAGFNVRILKMVTTIAKIRALRKKKIYGSVIVFLLNYNAALIVKISW